LCLQAARAIALQPASHVPPSILNLQVQLERMRAQEAVAAAVELQQRRDELQQQVWQQAAAVQAAQQQAEEAGAGSREAAQQVSNTVVW
jgi:hypothetical protein